MKSVNKLISEHDNILILTQIMESASIKLMSEGIVDSDDWHRMISFGRVYADKLHHQKEENILFHEMVGTLGNIAVKLIQNGMLVEHDLGRLYLKQLDEAVCLVASDKNSAIGKLNIVGNAVAYRDLLIRHIDKENDVVFNYGKNNLSKESIARVEELSSLEEEKEDTKALEKEQLDSLKYLQEKYL